MKNPTVSIIIPVYNAEGTITRCLDSIIHQTYSSIEVIIIKLSKRKIDEHGNRRSKER